MTDWTREKVAALGPVTDVPTTARIFLVDPETVYSQIRRGEWTVTRVLRMGRKIRIPTRDLISALYAPEMPENPAVPSPSNDLEASQVTALESHSQCGCHATPGAEIHTLRGA